MINFPKFYGRTAFFSAPVYVKLSYIGNDDFETWFKIIGYNEKGMLIGTSVNIRPSEDWYAVHSLELDSIQDDKIHHYSPTDREDYFDAFNKALNKLK